MYWVLTYLSERNYDHDRVSILNGFLGTFYVDKGHYNTTLLLKTKIQMCAAPFSWILKNGGMNLIHI